jgi:hypothetical protein
MVGQVQIVMAVEAFDTTVMESSIARFSDSCEVLTDIVAVIVGGVDVPLDIAPTIPLTSDPTLAAMFFQSEGTVNSTGAMFLMMIGLPLDSGGYSSGSWPGDWRTSSFVPSFHHPTFSSSPTDRRYL